MSRKISVVVLILWLVSISLATAGTNGEPATAFSQAERVKIRGVAEGNSEVLPSSAPAARSLIPHDPIFIDGNADFSDGDDDGVSNPGAVGTESDPYIIEDYDIDASTAHGILIKNTDVYFIIRNCVIHDGDELHDNNKYGVEFKNATNGKADNVTSYNNYDGIAIYLGSNNTVTNCNFYDNNDITDAGILLETTNNNTITNCNIYNNYHGVYLYGSAKDNIITNCNIYNSGSGILSLVYSSYNSITNCYIHDNSNGAYLDTSSNNNITNCDVYNNSQYGIWLGSSSDNNQITSCTIYNNSLCGIKFSSYTSSNNNSIYHNNFLNITQNAYDKYTNYWYNETLKEGNYWNDYTGYDSDDNGIGDDPYYIPGGSNRDNYPLLDPYPAIQRNAAILEYPKFENSIGGIKISCNISNTESMDIANLTVNFTVNSVLISSQKTDLPKNAVKTLTTTWQTGQGSYYVKVEANADKSISEKTWSDNAKETGIDIFDFSILKLTIPEKQAGGYEINATIYTEGPSTVYANVSVFINGIFYASQLPRLLHGNNTTVAFSWNPPTGDYSIIVKVNANLFLYESNIANNERSVEAKIQKILPDLSIDFSDIYFSKDLPDEEENITITAVIENLGYLQSQEAKVKFYDNDVLFSEQSLQPISTGGQQPVSTFWTAREGHTIKAIIDTLGNQEFNSDNNQAARYLTTTKKCDLAIGNITTDPSVLYEGKPAIIYAEVFNLGNATGEGVVSFYVLGALIGNTSTGTIQHGSLTKVSVLWSSARSWCTITIRVVSLKKEKDMTNNEGYKSIGETIIGPKQDLAITAVYFDPSTPIYNETCRICVNLTNLGNGTSVSALLEFYEGTNLIGNAIILPALPGGNDSCSINWIGKKGATIYVTILAIEEDDIVNNVKSVYVSYTARPDIAVELVRFSSESPAEGENVYIYADLKNIGDAPSKEAIIKFYANNVLIEQKQVSPLQPNQTTSPYVLWNVTVPGALVIKVIVEYEDTTSANNMKDILLEARYRATEPSDIIKEQAITLGGIITAILISISLYFKREAIGKFLFVTAPLQWKTEKDALKTETRKRIYECIREKGPSNPYQVQIALLDVGMKRHYTTITYELEKLKGWKILSARKEGHATLYYLPEMYKHTLEIPLEIKTQIVDFVILKKEPTHEEIVKELISKHQISEEDFNNFYERIDRIIKELVYKGILIRTFDKDRTPHYKYNYPKM